jgi:hypothetical protein
MFVLFFYRPCTPDICGAMLHCLLVIELVPVQHALGRARDESLFNAPPYGPLRPAMVGIPCPFLTADFIPAVLPLTTTQVVNAQEAELLSRVGVVFYAINVSVGRCT